MGCTSSAIHLRVDAKAGRAQDEFGVDVRFVACMSRRLCQPERQAVSKGDSPALRPGVIVPILVHTRCALILALAELRERT